MAYFISRSCVGTCDTACVDVCPCDCIVGPASLASIRAIPRDARGLALANVQLFIDPDECIDCGACVPQCPVDAIHHEDDAVEDLLEDVERNAGFFRDRARATQP